MFTIGDEAPGTVQLLLGNEAIARGALEAGIRVAAAYPGTPSTEIIETLARAARETGIYVEWSVNEKVAAEVAAAASYAGLRSLTAMKHEGMNVATDFLSHLNLIGVKGGMVVVVCDDPNAWSSTSENDSRAMARLWHVPLLEPSSAQECLDMTRWAFELSERLGTFCMVRSCTRVSHATGNVVVGELPKTHPAPHFDTNAPFLPGPPVSKHADLLKKEQQLCEASDQAPFNFYEGPERPDLLIVSSGTGRPYSIEAREILGLQESVGILHLGNTWPLPSKVVNEHLSRTSRVLVVEEVDPFLENNLRDLATDTGWLSGERAILGKRSGHMESYGELTPDSVIDAVAAALDVEHQPGDVDYSRRATECVQNLVVERGIVWCSGCPHRASLWAIKEAIRLDGRDGFVTGDIGCYAMDRKSGFQVTKTGSVMGAGAGLATGLGKLERFGFQQPVVAVAGDSTFFHAAIPALINAKYNRSNFTLVVLDNGATAMTGFQPHPGVGRDAMGENPPPVDVTALCHGLDIPVQVFDPFDLDNAVPALTEMLQKEGEGVRVVIMRRPCVLLPPRDKEPPYRVWVEQERCLGEQCGCSQYCTRVFKCPGLLWDRGVGKARIDEAMCTGCGLCTDICPASAIMKEPTHVPA